LSAAKPTIGLAAGPTLNPSCAVTINIGAVNNTSGFFSVSVISGRGRTTPAWRATGPRKLRRGFAAHQDLPDPVEMSAGIV